MAGLAAALNAPGCIDALRIALTPRGADDALSRILGVDGAILEVAVRAALPAVARVVGDPDTPQARVIAALAVDGVASASALDGGYADLGPVGLLSGPEPYAVILADAERDALVLARNGDGPGLYYARHRNGWLVASEPVALLRAGVPAEPDDAAVRDFVELGVCDNSPRTFFAGVSRVLAGEAVTLTVDGEVEAVCIGAPTPAASVSAALAAAISDGRVGVLLGPGLPGAALLGAALSRRDRLHPLPVHTATFPELDGPAAHTPAALVPLPFGSIRHVAHTFDPRGLELDAFLTDLGEPVPDLDLYLLWAIGRQLGAEVDTLVSSAGGTHECMARVRDRIAARYGVVVRSPLRWLDPRSELTYESIVDSTLPATVGRYAAEDSAGPVTAHDLLLAAPDEVAAALANARPWLDRAGNIDALRRLVAGEPVDADALLRAYLVERWLGVLARLGSASRDADRSARRRPADIEVAGTLWTRLPVPTEVFVPGDSVPAAAAWHVTNALTDLARDRTTREALRAPWFVVLSGKALAVSQRRVRPLWEVRPGRLARRLSRLAVPRLPRLAEGWTMQVALDDAGVLRVGTAVLLSRVRPAWAERLLPAAAANIFPPRRGAVTPADGSVVRAPHRPDEAATALIDALRFSLPPDLLSSLAGAAVVCADEAGSRLLGFAPGPCLDAVVDAEAVVALLCLDNPVGQGDRRTPVLLCYHTPPQLPAGSDIPKDSPDFPAHNKPSKRSKPSKASAKAHSRTSAEPPADEAAPTR